MNVYTPLLHKEEEDTCIICFHPFKNKKDIVNPCRCFTKYHKKCLKEWIMENKYKLKCEICNDDYSNISLKRGMSINMKNRILSICISTIIYTFLFSYGYMKVLKPINQNSSYSFFLSLFILFGTLLYIATFCFIMVILETKYPVFTQNNNIITFE